MRATPQVLLDKPLLDANHGAATDVQHLGNLPISVTGFALTLIAHKPGLGRPGSAWPGSCSCMSLFPAIGAVLPATLLDNGSDTFSCFDSFDCLSFLQRQKEGIRTSSILGDTLTFLGVESTAQ